MDTFLNFSEFCFKIKYQIFKFKKILNFSKMMSVFLESEVQF